MLAATPPVGELCALGAALTWAVAVVLFKRTGESVGPLALNMFKNVVGLVLFVATLAAAGELLRVGELFSMRDMP